MNGSICAPSPYSPRPYPAIRQAENGYMVSVYDREYVFGTFNEVVEFLREVFAKK